jgi:glycerophosphoryl diester phosphodiesterase
MLPQRNMRDTRQRPRQHWDQGLGRTMARMPHTPPSWPYPRWIAHRGAGTQAPENTLAAFRLGMDRGYRMVECDVQLSADGLPFLLHDATLDRTTNGHGPAHDRRWAELQALDAGAWHSPAPRGERLPDLDEVARFCHTQGCAINLELKPAPGTETQTGQAVAQRVRALWAGQAGPPPLLTSFQPAALEAARQAAPELPRGLLLDRWWPGAWDTASGLEVACVVAQHSLWSADAVAQVHNWGWRALAYTVNDPEVAWALQAWGVDGLITDRIDTLGP